MQKFGHFGAKKIDPNRHVLARSPSNNVIVIHSLGDCVTSSKSS